MTPETIVTLGQQALKVTALVSGPLLLGALVVGILVGMFQAVTSINEMTLSFIPKLLVVAAILMFAGSWMLDVMVSYMHQVFESIPNLIG